MLLKNLNQYDFLTQKGWTHYIPEAIQELLCKHGRQQVEDFLSALGKTKWDYALRHEMRLLPPRLSSSVPISTVWPPPLQDSQILKLALLWTRMYMMFALHNNNGYLGLRLSKRRTAREIDNACEYGMDLWFQNWNPFWISPYLPNGRFSWEGWREQWVELPVDWEQY